MVYKSCCKIDLFLVVFCSVKKKKHLLSLKRSPKFRILIALSCVHILVDSMKTRSIIRSSLHVKFIRGKLAKTVSS